MSAIADCLKRKWPEVERCYDQATLQRIEEAYREPQRAYHGTPHILDLLEKLDTYRSEATRPDLIAHAILWHDIVYLTYEKLPDGTAVHRKDSLNVEESARQFENSVIALPQDDKDSVVSMIRATSGHDPRLAEDHPAFNDTALFLDMDLSVLAFPYELFSECTRKIRAEYPHVGDRDFCLGRIQFLEAYGAKEKLFFHPVTAARYEAAARGNMRQQAEHLRSIVRSFDMKNPGRMP